MALQVERTRRLFTLEEYERIVRAGVFGPDDRLELIDGDIVEMSPIGPAHAACVDNLTRLFVLGVRNRAVVRCQGPVGLPPRSQPEPDLMLLRPRSYFDGPARTGDVLLIVEVAETSLRYDRTVKLRVYARAGVPEYWIVDVDGRAIDVHRDPGPEGYRAVSRCGPDGIVVPVAFPDLAIPVADLFV